MVPLGGWQPARRSTAEWDGGRLEHEESGPVRNPPAGQAAVDFAAVSRCSTSRTSGDRAPLP